MAAACGAESGWEYLLEKDALGPWAHGCPIDGGWAAHAAAARGCGGGEVGGDAARALAPPPRPKIPTPKRSVYRFI